MITNPPVFPCLPQGVLQPRVFVMYHAETNVSAVTTSPEALCVLNQVFEALPCLATSAPEGAKKSHAFLACAALPRVFRRRFVERNWSPEVRERRSADAVAPRHLATADGNSADVIDDPRCFKTVTP